MRHLISMAMLAWAVALGTCVMAAEPDPLAQLDEALKAVPAFEHGQDSAPLVAIEKMVFQLPRDSKLRGPVEGKLLAALEAAKTGDAKRFLCRQLRVIGTAQCVPHLDHTRQELHSRNGTRDAAPVTINQQVSSRTVKDHRFLVRSLPQRGNREAYGWRFRFEKDSLRAVAFEQSQVHGMRNPLSKVARCILDDYWQGHRLGDAAVVLGD